MVTDNNAWLVSFKVLTAFYIGFDANNGQTKESVYMGAPHAVSWVKRSQNTYEQTQGGAEYEVQAEQDIANKS